MEKISKRMTYNYVNGHIVISEPSGNFLLDTGSPTSFGRENNIKFMGRTYDFHKGGILGIDLDGISSAVGTRLDALLGGDILNRFDILVDPRTNTVEFSDQEIVMEGESFELKYVMGVPIFEANIDNIPARMILDTGAKLSYISPDIAKKYPHIGREQDFYPMIGTFETETYEVPVSFGKSTMKLSFGILPDILQTTLMVIGASGVLGTAILKGFVLCLSPKRKRLFMHKI